MAGQRARLNRGRRDPALAGHGRTRPELVVAAPVSSPQRRRLYRRQPAREDLRSSIVSTTDWRAGAAGAGQYAKVNGINLYFETHGAGRPLILLHGGLGSGEMYGPILPTLGAHYQVIAVDLQGHGRTADIDRPIDVRLMADDIAALIDHLGLDQPDLVGYSLGGGVALQTAARYPGQVRKLVAASANIRPDAIYPEIRAQQGQVNAAAAEFMKDTPMYELYQRVAPHPEDFPRLLDKIGEAMAKDFDFTEDVRGLRVPTLIVAADADMAPPSHYVEVFNLLDGGLRDGGWMGEGRPRGGHALAILPGLTHYNLFSSPLFAAVTLAFLDQPPG
jgi:pimeloyl-ACP methyl ester carboxylesterase